MIKVFKKNSNKKMKSNDLNNYEETIELKYKF